MASEEVPEELVVQEQEGQLHARSYTQEPVAERNSFVRGYTKEDQMVERDPAVHEQDEQGPPLFKLPKLPIPSNILDIPIKIPTHISDILGDLPLPTIPTDPGDIIDALPTDPGEIISDIPIPTLPVPVPTKIPGLPPPSKPRDPGDDDGFHLPDLTLIPHKVLGLLHNAIAQLGSDENLPGPFRDILRLIQRIISRLAGGHPVPKPPKKPKPTKTELPIPTLPTPTLPTPTLPTPTLPTGAPTPPTTSTRPKFPTLFPPKPKPTLTMPERAKQKARGVSGDAGKEPLSDGERKVLRDAVSDEVWSLADWSNPVLAPITAAGAMVAFDAVYLVAEAFKRTDDEDEQEELLSLLVVVDDGGDEEAMA